MEPRLNHANAFDDAAAVASASSAVAHLLQQVNEWSFHGPGLQRAGLAVEDLDPLAWLEANPLVPRCYWQDRTDRIRVAGLGSAWECVADGPARQAVLLRRAQNLARQHGVHLLCAFSFDGQAGSDQWQGFPGGLAMLPAIELQINGSGPVLSVNLYAENHSEFERRRQELKDLLRKLCPPTSPPTASARVTQRADNLDFDEYSDRLEAILGDIGDGRIQKAVLARQVAVQLDQSLPAFTTLARWSTALNRCYCFAIERAGRVFMGCSPERLFYREGQSVQTESLAGTVRRGQTAVEDAALESALRDDAKLVREHDWVTHHICSELEPWSIRIAAPEHAGVLKLDRIQHLRLPIEATLRPGVGDHHLLHALHPTAAVCGYPRDSARRLIDRQESFQRGWYSGVVGLLSGDSTDLAVAIRSVLVDGDQAWCFSGAGIVHGSVAETEWQELEAKIESFFSAVHG